MTSDIKKDTDKLYKDTKDGASSNYQDIKNSVDDAINHVKDNASDFYDVSKKKINEMQDSFEQHQDELTQLIKKNPLGSVLIAAGAGYLLSKILKN